MKTLFKIIVFVTAVLAAVYFFRNNGGDVLRRIEGWTERTAEHLESLAATSDEDTGSDEEQAPEANEAWYASLPSETPASAGDAGIISQVGLSSQGGNVGFPGSRGPDDQPADEFRGRSETENIQWVKKVTEKYAPTAWTLLMLYDALPSSLEVSSADGMVMTTGKPVPTFAFLDGNSATDLLHGMATNVHEIAHAYSTQYVFSHARDNGLRLNWDEVKIAYYLSPARTYIVTFPKASLFPAAELVRKIPGELRTFRFDEYIKGSTSTQGQGVLGLLDEFHAYFQGSLCGYELFDAYILAEGSEAKGLLEWITSLQSIMTAFWEFDFFIREYMLHMSKYYPDDYALLVRQGEFTRTYSVFRKAYSDLITRYDNRVTEMVDKLNGKDGYEAYIEEGTVWISHQSSTQIRGAQLFGKDRNILEPVISSHRYDQVEACLSGR